MVQVPQVTNWSVAPKNGAERYFTLMNTWIYESTNVINSYNQSIQKVNESIIEINAINQNVNTQAEQVTANTKTIIDATASASQSAKSASDSKLASLQSATNAKNEADRAKVYADSINPNDFIVPTPTKSGQVANKEYVDAKISKTSASNNSVIVNDGNGGIKNSSVVINDTGNLLVGTTTDNGVDKLQVNGSISTNTYNGAITEYGGYIPIVGNHGSNYAGDGSPTAAITDLNNNNLIRSGTYNGSDLDNAPVTGWIFVQHMQHSDTTLNDSAQQIVTTMGAGNTPNQMYIRTKVDGNWTAWVEK